MNKINKPDASETKDFCKRLLEEKKRTQLKSEIFDRHLNELRGIEVGRKAENHLESSRETINKIAYWKVSGRDGLHVFRFKRFSKQKKWKASCKPL